MDLHLPKQISRKFYQNINDFFDVCLCVFVRACMRAYVRAFVCVQQRL